MKPLCPIHNTMMKESEKSEYYCEKCKIRCTTVERPLWRS
jgi:tRNA(Ile2) C34 agmatinyltransferase TiaS